jgi:hypothetical protein
VDRRKLAADTHVVKADNFIEWWNKQADQTGLGTVLGMVGRHLLSGLSREDLETLVRRLAEAHVPPTYDWRAMLRLPREREPRSSLSGQPVSPPAAPGSAVNDGVQVIVTPLGEITLTRIPDGRYALRNDKNDALIEIVRSACKGKGQWNPRYTWN